MCIMRVDPGAFSAQYPYLISGTENSVIHLLNTIITKHLCSNLVLGAGDTKRLKTGFGLHGSSGTETFTENKSDKYRSKKLENIWHKKHEEKYTKTHHNQVI